MHDLGPRYPIGHVHNGPGGRTGRRTAGRFEALGIQVWPSTASEMESIIAADIAKWGRVIRNAGIEAN